MNPRCAQGKPASAGDERADLEVQRVGAASILAHVQGDDTKAVELLRAAADLEATMTSIRHSFLG
jgi:hypothetical protein